MNNEFPPTAEQSLILEAARGTPTNLLISALAGAAKTSTLVRLGRALASTPILCLAFNRKIAIEMKERLTSNCQAKTLNGLGHQVWMQTIGKRPTLSDSKMYDIMKDLIEALPAAQKTEAYDYFSETLKAAQSAKTAGYVSHNFTNAARLMDEEDLFSWLDDEPTDLQMQLIIEASRISVEQGMKGVIDFNDQILLPTVFPARFPQFPLVMVDEAQDLSALNHATLRKLVSKRIFAVGDACQPAGTLVDVVVNVGDRWNARRIKKVPIEGLQVNDHIVGYDTDYSEFMFNRKVKGISARPFKGNLIKVITQNGITKYTPNHHCFANFSRLRNHTALYLMRCGKRWRVGTAAMDYKQASGPIARARVEKADALWILTTFPTKQEALAAEAAIQAAYGIPDITFEWAGVHTKGYHAPDVLKSVWNRLDNIDFTERAFALLKDFGREPEYPIWEPTKTYATFKRPVVVHACNLLEGGEVLRFVGKKRERLSDWLDYEVRYEPYDGLVYSLSVSHNHLFIADGIVTHNCQAIYGFRGAHEDSMSKLRETFSMDEFTLSISFRCPQNVVKAAQWRAPHMRSAEGAPEGEVRTLTSWTVESIPHNAAVLCRNNAPIFRCALEFIKAGRYPQIMGADIGKSLVKTMKKFGPGTMPQDEVIAAIEKWRTSKLATSRSPGSIADQAECMLIFAEQGPTLSAALAYAEHLFNSDGPIKMMTIHKSKGLEFNDVFILNRSLIQQGKGQEDNLLYVAQTRAKRSLTYIEMEGYGA